ncbi:PucR family transcriptional regulator [Mycobacterium sp. SVM_VP21]|nr:PucR family transcriptional regulator [Mycobacterium sp. SVM_VP21]
MQWGRPSPRVRELIRQRAEMVLSGSQGWLSELDQATLASPYIRAVADDPVLAESIRQCNRSIQLHWVAANISHPGEPVPANVGTESLTVARDLIRRGMDESAVVDWYRIGQDFVWRHWMRKVFTLTSDPDELRDVLDVSARSMAAFVDATIAGIYHQIQAERDELTRGTHAERREIVGLILDGAPITQRQAERQLGYEFERNHTALVIWSARANTALTDLDRVTETILRSAAGTRPLSVLAGAGTRWVWIPGEDGHDLADVITVVNQLAGVRMAVGPTAAGIDGFRRSHLDAISTQRMMAQFGATQRVVRFTDVELVAALSTNTERADRFVKHTLGEFESADAELQRTVLTFVHEQCHASRAAERLFVHRNTLLRRLVHADSLLPKPLKDSSVHVAVALEVLRWRAAAPQNAP